MGRFGAKDTIWHCLAESVAFEMVTMMMQNHLVNLGTRLLLGSHSIAISNLMHLNRILHVHAWLLRYSI